MTRLHRYLLSELLQNAALTVVAILAIFFMVALALVLGASRTEGSAHALMRAASGIEMALWDLAGKILGVPSTVLLGGKFRDKVRVYDHARPRDLLNRSSCEEWAQQVKEDPAGITCHKRNIQWPSTKFPTALLNLHVFRGNMASKLNALVMLLRDHGMPVMD